MTVHEKIGGLLDTLSLPYYARMPTFAAGEEPELYIVYTIDNRVKSRSDGKINALEYTVTLNVFGRDETAVDEAADAVMSLFESSSIYFAGCSFMSGSDFPQKFRRIMDFKTMCNVQCAMYND